MTITEFIAELEAAREKYGDLRVCCESDRGKYLVRRPAEDSDAMQMRRCSRYDVDGDKLREADEVFVI